MKPEIEYLSPYEHRTDEKFLRSDFFHEQLQPYEKSYDEKVRVWQINEALSRGYEAQRAEFYMGKKRRSIAESKLVS